MNSISVLIREVTPSLCISNKWQGHSELPAEKGFLGAQSTLYRSCIDPGVDGLWFYDISDRKWVFNAPQNSFSKLKSSKWVCKLLFVIFRKLVSEGYLFFARACPPVCWVLWSWTLRSLRWDYESARNSAIKIFSSFFCKSTNVLALHFSAQTRRFKAVWKWSKKTPVLCLYFSLAMNISCFRTISVSESICMIYY